MKSRLYWELKERYITKKLEPFVLVGLLCWVAYLYMQIQALPYEVTRPIITLTLSQ